MQLLLFKKELPVLQDLVEEAKLCTDCSLCNQEGGGVAFYDGTPHTDVMFIGEAPGENEAIQGKPFVGRAGKLLTLGLNKLGLPRESVYITNVCKHRPANNRTPTPLEQSICSTKFLAKELQIVDPKVIVPLGNPAMRFFLGAGQSISRTRGKWYQYDGRLVLPMFHPAYVLRNPDRSEGSPADLLWKDLCKLKNKLTELENG